MRWLPLQLVFLITSSTIPSSAGTLFSDDFSTPLSQWETSGQAWSVKAGWLEVIVPDGSSNLSQVFVGNSTWTDYRVEFDVVQFANINKFCYFRYHDETSGYFLNLRLPLGEDPGAVRLFKLDDKGTWPWGSWTLVDAAYFPNMANTVYHVSIEAVGPVITVFVNGAHTLEYEDTTDNPFLSGRIGLAGFNGSSGVGAHIMWDNVRVTELQQPVAVQHTTWGRIKRLYR